MKKFTMMLIGLATWINFSHADESTRYVRDWMSIPLREYKAPDSKIVHPGLVSGAVLTVLETDEDKGYSRVRAADGSVGWIGTRFLTAEPIAKVQLEKANAELQQLRSANEQLQIQLSNLPADSREAAQQLAALRTENKQLKAEIETFKQASSDTAQIVEENSQLKLSNEKLQNDLDVSTAAADQLRAGKEMQLFREGAIAVIAGALLTLIIPRLWPKKKSDWT